MSDKKDELTFWGHLTELLSRFRTAAYALIISTIVVMVAPISIDLSNITASNPWYQTIASFVIKKLQTDFLPEGITLLPISWFAPLEVYVYVSIMLGVLISSPVIMYELYKFINPALRLHERRFVYPVIIAFTGLFLFGFSLGYLLIIPATMRAMVMFTGILQLPAVYGFSDFFSVVMMTLLITGFIFTFPIYVVLLVQAGIITTEQIKKRRKYIYFGSIILISIIDPEPGLVTEAVCIIPIIILLEASLLIARRYEKQREQAETQ